MKRSKKSPKPLHKPKFPPKKFTSLFTSKNTNKTANPKVQSTVTNNNNLKVDLKKQNKKKLNNSYTTRVYMLGSGIIFFVCLHFIFSNNFNQIVSPIPTTYDETPIAASLDFYYKFSNPSMMQFFHFFTFIMALYYLFYSIRCEAELSFAYCLIILLDPYFPAHFFSSNFLFFSLLISIISFKCIFYSLTSFKRVDRKYKLTMLLVCFLNGINLSIRFESFSIILVQAIATFLRAFKKKKVNKELILAPIIMLIAEFLIAFIIAFKYGYPNKISFHYEKFTNFKDELKIYDFSKAFIPLGVCALVLSLTSSNFKLSHKVFLLSTLICSFLSLLIPIRINEYSIQIRLLYMQFMLYVCFGVMICRTCYLCVSGTFLGIFITVSWIIRYHFTPSYYSIY